MAKSNLAIMCLSVISSLHLVVNPVSYQLIVKLSSCLKDQNWVLHSSRSLIRPL